METAKELKLAVLIDADNVPYSNIKGMLQEIAKYGSPTFKRIYGDWTKPTLSGWKTVLLENAITPIQQYSYTTGKKIIDDAGHAFHVHKTSESNDVAVLDELALTMVTWFR